MLVGAVMDFNDIVERSLEEGKLPKDHCEERVRITAVPMQPRPGAEALQLLLFQELGTDKKGLTDSPGRREPFIYPQSRHNRSSNQPPPCSLASML